MSERYIPQFYRSSVELESINKRMHYREELHERTRGNFWKSADIALPEPYIFEPNSLSFVTMQVPSGLELFDGMPVETFAYAGISTRSRLAQGGLFVVYGSGSLMADTMEGPCYDAGSDILQEAHIIVWNHSDRPIFLPEETGLFRLYFQEHTTNVFGKQFEQLFTDELITVDGELGKDWGFATFPGSKTVNALLLPLETSQPKTIAPSPFPLHINGQSGIDYRKFIDEQMIEIPYEKGHNTFWIAETKAKVTLDSSVDGLIQRWVGKFNNRPFTYDGFEDIDESDHEASPLIDGGFSGKIRTEISNYYYDKNNLPDCIYLFLHHSYNK